VRLAFVPPLAKAKIPAKVTAPLVAVLGVNPVVPALKVVAVAADTTFVPSQYRIEVEPLGTETPVPAEVFNVTANPPDTEFLIM
jgi:hypothetical protein